MSTYFFHLRLELYPFPAVNKRRKLAHSNTGPDHPAFVPPAGSDIFKTTFPTHRSSKWASYSFPGRQILSPISSVDAGGKQKSGSKTNNGYDSESTPRKQRYSLDCQEPLGDAVLLPERSTNLKQTTPPSGVSTTKPTNESAAQDWRYNTVEIESIDMETKAKGSANGLHTKGVYLPSDPKTTDVGWGIVHLYRDTEESNVLGEQNTIRKASTNEAQEFDQEKCTTLCVPAVPSWMMPSDLLGFVGDQAREDVSHFRLIRTGRANKYMVLMKFRSSKKAREWQKANNGRLFSAAEPENCHVVFIKTVQFLSPESGTGSSANNFPHNTNDPFTSADPSRSSQGFSSRPLAPPPPNLLELPTCPVCLERMDETTGLLTILCQHVFHCACLEKWRGSGCPVCRYTHSPSYTFPYPRPSYDGSSPDTNDISPSCSTCASTSNLWICLICGNVGCGRYDSAHAYAHYESTSHCYAMDISTQHVWDYAGDGYVHRLIQSKPTTTTNEPLVPRHENEAFRAESSDSVPRDKMESMAAEYTYLLTSQLEGQRRYFEEQVERAVDKASEASSRAEEALAASLRAQSSLDSTLQLNSQLSADLERLRKSLEKSELARKKSEQLARAVTASLKEEKSMGEGLMERLKIAEGEVGKVKEEGERWKMEKEELEEMNRDLTMFISGQEKVRELEERGEGGVAGGDVVVPETTTTTTGSGSGGGGGGKRKGKGRKK